MLTFNEQLSRCAILNRKKYLKRLIGPLNGNIFNAEDILQESYCKALEFQVTFDENKGTFENWLSRIIYNTLYDFLRDKIENKEEDISKYEQVVEIDYLTLIDNRLLVNRLIKLHPDPLSRKFLTLYFLKGYSIKDIMFKLKINENKCRKIIFRFKKYLLKKYSIGV